jgi:hypothetical protein
MRLAATILSLSLAPFAFSAQTTLKDVAAPVTPWSNVSGCPVSLQATQISSADMMQVRKGQPQNTGQRLHLVLADRDSKQIVAATVAVQGFTFTPRMMNAGNTADLTARKVRPGEEAQKGSSQATRTIHMTFQAGTSVAADIVVEGVSATQTIDLIALSYADGTKWKLAEGQSCRIAPDPLMLISATSR